MKEANYIKESVNMDMTVVKNYKMKVVLGLLFLLEAIYIKNCYRILEEPYSTNEEWTNPCQSRTMYLFIKPRLKSGWSIIAKNLDVKIKGHMLRASLCTQGDPDYFGGFANSKRRTKCQQDYADMKLMGRDSNGTEE